MKTSRLTHCLVAVGSVAVLACSSQDGASDSSGAGAASGAGGWSIGGSGGVPGAGGWSIGGSGGVPGTGGTGTGGAGTGGAGTGGAGSGGAATGGGGAGGENTIMDGGTVDGSGGFSGGTAGSSGSAGTSGGGGTGGSTPSNGCGTTPEPCAPCNLNGLDYYVDIPDNYDANRPYPVVFQYHPLGGSAEMARTMYRVRPIFQDAIYVSQQGSDNGFPNSGGVDEEMTRAIIADIEARLCTGQGTNRDTKTG